MDRSLDRITLPALTAKLVAQGHPWVYADDHLKTVPPPGTLLHLLDPKGKTIGMGISDEGAILIRVLTADPQPLATLLKRRVQRAWRLSALCGPDTDCCRLLNGEGDGLGGLVVDRYGPVLVVRLYSHAWVPHLPLIVGALQDLPGVRTIYRRLGVGRVDGSEGGDVLHGPPPPEALVVQEHGMKLLVRVEKGQKTGLFLDQREHRLLIRRWAGSRTVLNLFSYNGGFSVAAALGGAPRVVSVDQSAPALADAKEIFRLNGLDPDRHGFEVADVFRYVAHPQAAADLLICDPPSLAHARPQEKNAWAAYRDLHTRIAPLARELLATSSCTARLPQKEWEDAVIQGLPERRGWAWLHRSSEPTDHPVLLNHPEGRYLKFALLSRL